MSAHRSITRSTDAIHTSTIHPTPINKTRTRRVNIPNFTPLHPKHMTIRRTLGIPRPIQPRKPHKNIHNTHHLIHNILAICHGDMCRHLIARVCRKVFVTRIRTAFEAGAGYTPGDLHGNVVAAVCIGFPRCFDHLVRVACGLRDGKPGFLAVPVLVACCVEGPVALVSDDAVDEVYVAFGI
ncbi:hypothetical protein CUC08_Gglean001812 [Alternaria sp. MG1]|nr:hypothetical protein CUC08_Gglean001812 [Alternaria sp. MG1]